MFSTNNRESVVKLDRLLNIDRLNENISAGYVSARRHPHIPLIVFKYTQKTIDEEKWDDITTHCRDLVADHHGEVIANCFKSSEPPLITRISAFTYKTELRFVCNGSFEDKNVSLAHEIVREKPEYRAAFSILCADSSTAICEISEDDLALVGTIANFELADGTQLWTPALNLAWPGTKVHGRP